MVEEDALDHTASVLIVVMRAILVSFVLHWLVDLLALLML